MKLTVLDTVTAASITVLMQEQPAYGARATYPEEAVRGTSDPHIGYSHTEGQTVSFQTMICSSLEVGDTRTPQNVIEDIAWLQSLCYPDYQTTADGGIATPPHKVTISMLPMAIEGPPLDAGTPKRSWTGYLVDVQIAETGGYDLVTGSPFHAKATITMRVVGPRLAGIRWIG
ncbi:MAG: hypothetical protein A2Y38_04570 [Spirochaetes bacterium GWB1_59_5]|nr:MAG: hypothetical protein A2Y38_04570 [Spirochaetes bacterium GWB1_59_5]